MHGVCLEFTVLSENHQSTWSYVLYVSYCSVDILVIHCHFNFMFRKHTDTLLINNANLHLDTSSTLIIYVVGNIVGVVNLYLS